MVGILFLEWAFYSLIVSKIGEHRVHLQFYFLTTESTIGGGVSKNLKLWSKKCYCAFLQTGLSIDPWSLGVDGQAWLVNKRRGVICKYTFIHKYAYVYLY